MTDAWLPIETAPKDGTCVVIGAHGDFSDAGFYHDGSGCRRGNAGWFFEEDRRNLLTAKNCRPTHWMEFPDPSTVPA